jgi:hypothetical protein
MLMRNYSALLAALLIAFTAPFAVSGAQAEEWVAGDALRPYFPGDTRQLRTRSKSPSSSGTAVGTATTSSRSSRSGKSPSPDDVVVKGSPAMWNGLMEVHAGRFMPLRYSAFSTRSTCPFSRR